MRGVVQHSRVLRAQKRICAWTCDVRSMSGFYFVLSMLLSIPYFFTGTIISTHSIFTVPLLALLLLVAVVLFALVRPYKDTTMNITDTLLLLLLVILGSLFLIISRSDIHDHESLAVMFLSLMSLPQIAFVAWGIYKVLKKTGFLSMVHWKMRRLAGYDHITKNCHSRIPDELPDRLINPREYEPLISPSHS